MAVRYNGSFGLAAAPARPGEADAMAGWTCLLMGSLLAADDPAAWPRQWRSDFAAQGVAGWDFTDAKAWRAAPGPPAALELHAASKYSPKVRSPLNIAWLQGEPVGDFVLDLDVRSTARDYGHRDLCLFFGRQDAEHFYYVHLAKAADPHAHSIFLVDGKPRVSIAKRRTAGVAWTDGWHHVKMERSAAGRVAVWFDRGAEPVMEADDRTFPAGRVGVGSFDDTGLFANLSLSARPATPAGPSGGK